jgi:glutathione S-transferase
MTMLRLHHSRASTASTIVRLVLAEKRLAFDDHILDLRRGDQHTAEYRAIHPRGLVPALEHDGRVICESAVIAVYLDDTFPEPPLVPSGARARVQAWLDRIADRIHPATTTLTFALAFRRALAQRPREELEAHFARITEADLRERERAAVLHGLDAPQVPSAFATHAELIDAMDEALAAGEYLAGAHYSLADAAVTPYIVRDEMLGLAALWANKPRVARWLATMRARPSFDVAISQVLTDADRERLTVPPDDSSRLFAR